MYSTRRIVVHSLVILLVCILLHPFAKEMVYSDPRSATQSTTRLDLAPNSKTQERAMPNRGEVSVFGIVKPDALVMCSQFVNGLPKKSLAYLLAPADNFYLMLDQTGNVVSWELSEKGELILSIDSLHVTVRYVDKNGKYRTLKR